MTAGAPEQDSTSLSSWINIIIAFKDIDLVRVEDTEFLLPRRNRSQSARLFGQQPLAAHPELKEVLRMRSCPDQIEVYGSIHSHLHAFRQLRPN